MNISSDKLRTFIFDLHTKQTFDEVGGKKHIEKMGISIATLLDFESGELQLFSEKDLDKIINLLKNAYLVVGINLQKFSFRVLEGISHSNLSSVKNLDILKYVKKKVHFKPAPEDLFAATLEKSLKIDSSSQKQQMAVFELLKIHFRLQNYKESEKWINEVESYFYQNEKDYWLTLLFFKGFVKYYTNQVEESERIFEELLENSQDDPRRATGLFGLAFINFHRKNYLNTINLCETVTKHDPAFFDMESVGFLTAVSFKYLGRDDIFEKYYAELKKNYPEGRYSAELAKIRKGEIEKPEVQS